MFMINVHFIMYNLYEPMKIKWLHYGGILSQDVAQLSLILIINPTVQHHTVIPCTKENQDTFVILSYHFEKTQ